MHSKLLKWQWPSTPNGRLLESKGFGKFGLSKENYEKGDLGRSSQEPRRQVKDVLCVCVLC